MRRVSWLLLLVLTMTGLVAAAVPVQVRAAGTGVLDLAPGYDTVTGVIEIRAQVPTGINRWAITAQMGHPGDYPTARTLATGGMKDIPDDGTIRYQWLTDQFEDGYWTIRLMGYNIGDTTGTELSERVVTVDNRWGIPHTEPGVATGQIKVAAQATGTVGVNVTVDPGAVEWILYKQPAADFGTNRWTKLYSSGLRNDTFHWYTRSEAAGTYTLRLEVRDYRFHRQFVTSTVTIDNRLGLPQTEPGTAQADLNVPAIVSGGLPVPLNFTGVVSSWRLQYFNPDKGGSPTNFGFGQGGAPTTAGWDTTKVQDGTYMVILEVEDEHRHIYQTTATTTVANKITSTLKQDIGLNEEHRYNIAVAGGLTAFKLTSTPVGYYQVSIETMAGKSLGSVRVNNNSLPLQLDLPGGKYVLSVKSLFVLPGSQYSVDMTGATAYTIPLAKLITNLPLSMRQVASLPALVPPTSTKPVSGDWSLDAGLNEGFTKSDSTVDIDTRPLAEGLHMLTFRAVNPVGFTTVTRFPFVVDNRPSFSDVPDTDPTHWAVELLHDQNVVKGYDDGTFGSNENVTRAQLAKMLAVVDGLDVTQPYSGVFADVSATDWFAPYVEAAYRAGIVKGYNGSNGSMLFQPANPVSRAELMVMMLRSLSVPEVLTASGKASLTNPDWRAVADWAKPSVYVGLKMNLLSEREGGRLDADQPAMRGEVAVALARISLNGYLGTSAGADR